MTLSLYNLYLIRTGVLETRNKMPVTIRAYWLFRFKPIETEQTLVNMNLQQISDNRFNVDRKKRREIRTSVAVTGCQERGLVCYCHFEKGGSRSGVRQNS